MLVASVSYATAFGFQSFSHFVKIIFSAVLVDFLGLGLVISTLYWFITNNYMRIRRVHVADQKVEWLYAFDVHCNSFFPLFIILYVIQFFLSPVLIRSTSIIATILGNSLYLLACSYYHYISFLGYDALPFLGHTSRLLAPIPALIVVFLLANVFNINISYHVLKYYFS